MGLGSKTLISGMMSLALGFNIRAQSSASAISERMKGYALERNLAIQGIQPLKEFCVPCTQKTSDCGGLFPSMIFSDYTAGNVKDYFVIAADSLTRKEPSMMSDVYYLVKDKNASQTYEPTDIEAYATLSLLTRNTELLTCEQLRISLLDVRDNYTFFLNEPGCGLKQEVYIRGHIYSQTEGFRFDPGFSVTLHPSADTTALHTGSPPGVQDSPATPPEQVLSITPSVVTPETQRTPPGSLSMETKEVAETIRGIFTPGLFEKDQSDTGFISYPKLAYRADQDANLAQILSAQDLRSLDSTDFVLTAYSSRMNGASHTRFAPGHIYMIGRDKGDDGAIDKSDLRITIEQIYTDIPPRNQGEERQSSFKVTSLETGESYTTRLSGTGAKMTRKGQSSSP
jgi:hypothetical protein